MNANQKAAARAQIELAYKRAARLPYGQAAPINRGLFSLKELLTRDLTDDIVSMVALETAEPTVRQIAYEVCGLLDLEVEIRPLPFVNYFELVAGKLEGDGERNVKVVDAFRTFGQAWDELQACQSYHFAEIVYIDHNGQRWDINPTARLD